MKYEYDITILQGPQAQIRATLNEWGAKGWENYAIIGGMAYFRRPAQETPKKLQK